MSGARQHRRRSRGPASAPAPHVLAAAVCTPRPLLKGPRGLTCTRRASLSASPEKHVFQRCHVARSSPASPALLAVQTGPCAATPSHKRMDEHAFTRHIKRQVLTEHAQRTRWTVPCVCSIHLPQATGNSLPPHPALAGRRRYPRDVSPLRPLNSEGNPRRGVLNQAPTKEAILK